MAEENNSTGTARLLHELTEYDSLVTDYDKETAVSLTTRALQRRDKTITKADTKSAIKVCKALLSGGVDIRAERERAEQGANKAAGEIVSNIQKSKNTTEV